MSKPTDYNVSPYDFKSVFGFTPCQCHTQIRTAAYATYRVEYETLPFDTILKKVTVTCDGCYRSVTRNIESENIDGSNIHF